MSPPPTTDGGDTLLRVAVWTCLYAVPLVVAMMPNLDYDIWWHLRVGQWVVENGTAPTTDPFSTFGITSGKPWIAYSWLFEVLAWEAFHRAGAAGLILGRSVLTLLICAALHVLIAKRVRHFMTAAAMFGLAALAMLPLITDRPWLFTILFFTLILDAVLDLREGLPVRRAWLLPLMFVLWANLHIQFVYGLFLLMLACAAPLIDSALKSRPEGRGADRPGTASWWQLVGVTFLCAMGTLATPYHVHMFAVIGELATHRVPSDVVAEFQALQFRHFWDWCVLALGAWAVFALGRRRGGSSFEVLLLAVAACFAFKGRRDLWFLVLASLAVIPASLPRQEQSFAFRPTWKQALAVAVCVLVILGGYWHCAHLDESLAKKPEDQYPVQAARFVRDQGFSGPLYNSFDWGGYLIWALPEHPVAMDGRTNLHTDARIARHVNTWNGRDGWADDPELNAAGVVIAERGLPLASLLRTRPGFRLVYEDEVAVVFVRGE